MRPGGSTPDRPLVPDGDMRRISGVGQRANKLERRYLPGTGEPDLWQNYAALAADEGDISDAINGTGSGPGVEGWALIQNGIRGPQGSTLMGNMSAVIGDPTALAGAGALLIYPSWSPDSAGTGPYMIFPSKVGTGIVRQASAGGDSPADWPAVGFDLIFEENSYSMRARLWTDRTLLSVTNPFTLTTDDQILAYWECPIISWD